MAQAEVLWAAASLMLLGAAVGVCVRCQLWASKREKQQSERRRELENQRSFEVIRSRSMLTTRRLEQNKASENSPVTRKSNEELGTTRRVGSEDRAESRYQNFLKEDQLHEEAAYIDPISWDYYNWMNPGSLHGGREEDSFSYQNVVVGACLGSSSVTDDAGDYENSTAIRIWTLQQESPDEEPDYVNTDPASGLASLPEQSTSRRI
ncbi:linker for activation of T-cells family member 2 [Nothoprocta perdicaria]|uniref:linker for activation of T-cells family member 2 n=1 Tax=Nothoprocta perdicaria TaxID=30464 RepID=UPI000E1B900E|nr:linker for activation of T-cells family member 2 [Nothoprocta perdicaria]